LKARTSAMRCSIAHLDERTMPHEVAKVNLLVAGSLSAKKVGTGRYVAESKRENGTPWQIQLFRYPDIQMSEVQNASQIFNLQSSIINLKGPIP